MDWVPVKKKQENVASQPSSLAADFASSNASIATSSTLDESVLLVEDHQLIDKSCEQNLETSESEKGLMFMKLKEIAHTSESSDSNVGHVAEFGSSDDAACEGVLGIDDSMTVKRSCDGTGSSLNTPDYTAVIEQVHDLVECHYCSFDLTYIQTYLY